MLNTKEYYTGADVSMHRHPWLYMDLKKSQYGPASENLEVLLTALRDFHPEPEVSEEKKEWIKTQMASKMSTRFYGDIGGDSGYVDYKLNLCFQTIYEMIHRREN